MARAQATVHKESRGRRVYGAPCPAEVAGPRHAVELAGVVYGFPGTLWAMWCATCGCYFAAQPPEDL